MSVRCQLRGRCMIFRDSVRERERERDSITFDMHIDIDLASFLSTMSRLIAPLVAAKLTMAQKIVGHVFRDAQLGVEALTAPGAVRTLENGALSYDGNASLALLGDGILRVGVGLQSRRLCETKGMLP